MSEYRRFIAYFYEYIDGKKQGNVGFVKVELRNGLWRFFLRLTVGTCPVPPIQVYGFVRERDYLLGLPLGTVRSVQQITEEWAFRDDAPIGEGKHGLEELSGIWIESSDGRRFITVWDGEEADAGRLVTEAEAAAEEDAETEPEEDGIMEDEEKALSVEDAEAESEEDVTMADTGEALSVEGAEAEPEEDVAVADDGEALLVEDVEAEPEEDVAVADDGEALLIEDVESEPEEEENVAPDMAEQDEDAENECAESEQEEQIEGELRAAGTEHCEPDMPERGRAVLEELFQKRAVFQPFVDAQIESCVMILPCDIARLQQENWQVGRSSFLQHGFYQYRHLLLGRVEDGTYILGVPGINNPQEEYMAQMFGYEQFRRSARRDGGQTFGYWCRALRQT